MKHPYNLRLILLVSCVATSIRSQTQENFSLHLVNDDQLLYQIYTSTSAKGGERLLRSIGEGSGNGVNVTGDVLTRTFVNAQGIVVAGFTLRFRRMKGTSDFRLDYEPIHGDKPLKRADCPTHAMSGERVWLYLGTSPVTGEEVGDVFQVGIRGTPMQLLAPAGTVPVMIEPGSVIRLDHPWVSDRSRSEEKQRLRTGAMGSVSGMTISIDIPRKGRVIVSSKALSGATLSAISEGNNLWLAAGYMQLLVTSKAPIISQEKHGSRAIWLKYEPSIGYSGSIVEAKAVRVQ